MAKKISHHDYLCFFGLMTLMAEHDRATKSIEQATHALLKMDDVELEDFYRTHAYDALHGNRDPSQALRLMGIEVEAPIAKRHHQLQREEAIELARRFAKAKPQSYYADCERLGVPFEPHEWVVDAILAAANNRADDLDA